MSTKRGKLTAGKARERIASLEESISARQHRLEQLEARLVRSESPDERLVTAKQRLERRLTLERDQLEKLLKLLGRDEVGQPEESGEFFVSEEIDDLHRSFEEVRQNLAQMQVRIENSELPRDLPTRLSSFEERISRREEVDSELFSQVLSLQTALDQERQTVRRLSRRMREQDQSLDALREAVEDSVMATVDLAERLDELEETLNGTGENAATPTVTDPTGQLGSELEMLRELVQDTRQSLFSLHCQVSETVESSDPSESYRLSAEEAVWRERLEALESSQGILLQRVDLLFREDTPKSAAISIPPRWPDLGPAIFAKNGVAKRSTAIFSSRPPYHR